MKLDGIIERSDIEFSREISLDELEKMLESIAKDLKYNLRYETKKFTEVMTNDSRYSKRGHESFVSGEFSAEKAGLAAFRCEADLFYQALRFNRIPGYEVSEHRPDEVEVWDKVREKINAYLSAPRKV